ncbi:hypothetical protein TVAG_122230 [Trichomonas vaginalis G3]|uniref:Uncharacterized protein n=1 Tax=Trichomonas vaginalis (strain ATCC PRA-98 / G3) TaxID=412133 RepID=A2DMY0_TRIV3|nr:hypothetical protein TVAGG3_1010310 [Trichomonas vaginalis G3]EAY18157.1 hypothetical protein TVAG_122230 [Trichomonas vaginalis G3]KAI5491454.1 hypothetical protein TVAGG3_1010310 [Trichomonas vaginalis G3]|eukprot:XP_001579143.1 hypothetical protein [Trichomonas vaginalis G3]
MKTGGLGLGLGLGLKKNQPQEEPEIQINDGMLIEDIDNSVARDIISVFEKNQAASNAPPLEDAAFIESSLKLIQEETKAQIFGPLMSVAHQIDSGISTVNDFKTELSKSQADLLNAPHARNPPTQFITRSVDRLQSKSIEISQILSAYTAKFQAFESIQQQNPIGKILKSEHHALIRVASKVAQVRSRYEALRNEMLQKLPTNILTKFEESMDSSEQASTSDIIETNYQSYITEKKNKFDKWREEIDLFGESTAPPPAQTTKFSLGAKPALGGSKLSTSK